MEFEIWYYQIYIITFLCNFNTPPPESHTLLKIANKKKIKLSTWKILENQFSKLKSKNRIFGSAVVQWYYKAVYFAYGLTMGRMTVPPTKKPLYTWQHWYHQ